MRGFFLRANGKISVAGWLILLLATILPPLMLSDALELPEGSDLGMSVLWFIAVSYGARRTLGVRL